MRAPQSVCTNCRETPLRKSAVFDGNGERVGKYRNSICEVHAMLQAVSLQFLLVPLIFYAHLAYAATVE